MVTAVLDYALPAGKFMNTTPDASGRDWHLSDLLNFTPFLRELTEQDVPTICSWVSSTAALATVSGNKGDRLTDAILATWVAKADAAFVCSLSQRHGPVGFCTLSRVEAEGLPSSHIEICHLVVSPAHRHLFVGSRLCAASKAYARENGFSFVCGRVMPDNKYTLALARLHHFDEITGTKEWTAPGFRWFERAVRSRVEANTRR